AREHAIAKAVWRERRTWEFLGTHGCVLPSHRRDEHNLTHTRLRGTRTADSRQETAAEQARRFVRGDRRHRRGLVRGFWRAWCETAWRSAAGSPGAVASRSALGGPRRPSTACTRMLPPRRR